MITVLLAEHLPRVHGAMMAVLGYEPDIDVVADVETGPAVLDAAMRAQPDVVLLDVDLPGRDGLAAAGELAERLPKIQTLLLTAEDREVAPAAAARAGGFVVREAGQGALAGAIRTVAAGRTTGRRHVRPDPPRCPLAAHELTILRLAAEDKAPAEIESMLTLSAGTVRHYFSSIIGKLHARNRADAVRAATWAGWV